MILGKLRELIERKQTAAEVTALREAIQPDGGDESELELIVFRSTGLPPSEWRQLDIFGQRTWLRACLDSDRRDKAIAVSGLSGEELALAVLVSHPEWSDTAIAKHVGCGRTSLYRWPRYVAAREALESGRYQRPKASEL